MLAQEGHQASVEAAMTPDAPVVNASANLVQTVEKLQGAEVGSFPVLRNGKLVGLLTMENVSELVMVRNAEDEPPEHAAKRVPVLPEAGSGAR